MKICLINLTTKEIVEDVHLANINKKKYCEKYNIDYRFYLGRASKRHAQWDKIQCVLQNLPEYDYIIWMDSDAIFNNFDTSILEIIKNNQEYDALFCSDVCYTEGQNHLLVNTGVMIFKNSEWSFNILHKVWESINDYAVDNLKKHSYDGFPHEQGKICEELIREDDSKFKIFPSEVFNQHPNSSNDQTFIVHHMGSRQTENHIQNFKQKVIESNNRLKIKCDNEETIGYIKLKPLKISVISSYTDNIKDVAEITTKNKKEYCEKHGYNLHINNGRLSFRHPGWDKIKLINKRMDVDDCDYFVWIDNDAYITNNNLRFDFICNNYSNKNFIICSEEHANNLEYLDPSIDFNQLQNLRLINTGVFIIKNNEWGKRFLEEIWETKSNTNQGEHCSHAEIRTNNFTYDFWPFEQGPLHIALSKKKSNEYKILPCEIMNIFSSRHKKHNFICHFVGTHNNAEAINQYVYTLKQQDFDINNMTLIDKKENQIVFKNNLCLLKYDIYGDSGESRVLKYYWDFSKTKEKNLSHCFKINKKKEISFGSKSEGAIKYKLGDVIEHSYDWFGEKNWVRII